jgi:hypothetical protein
MKAASLAWIIAARLSAEDRSMKTAARGRKELAGD